MAGYRICTLYSGSGGNAVLIEAGGTRILIDAGKSARTLCASLCRIGVEMESISAIFITHEHHDHVSALETLAKKHEIPIHITAESAKKFDRLPADSPLLSRLVCHPPLFEEAVGEMRVRSFRTPHDSRMSVGYRVEFCEGKQTKAVGLATDIGYVTEEIARSLYGCEAVVLESNHDIEMLENGPYPRELKTRILSRRGHLCNEESARLAAYLAEGGAKRFLLAHLSEENNTPSLARDAYESALADERICLAVASPDEPTELLGEGWEEVL